MVKPVVKAQLADHVAQTFQKISRNILNKPNFRQTSLPPVMPTWNMSCPIWDPWPFLPRWSYDSASRPRTRTNLVAQLPVRTILFGDVWAPNNGENVKAKVERQNQGGPPEGGIWATKMTMKATEIQISPVFAISTRALCVPNPRSREPATSVKSPRSCP